MPGYIYKQRTGNSILIAVSLWITQFYLQLTFHIEVSATPDPSLTLENIKLKPLLQLASALRLASANSQKPLLTRHQKPVSSNQ